MHILCSPFISRVIMDLTETAHSCSVVTVKQLPQPSYDATGRIPSVMNKQL